jgi:hypothetical protein
MSLRPGHPDHSARLNPSPIQPAAPLNNCESRRWVFFPAPSICVDLDFGLGSFVTSAVSCRGRRCPRSGSFRTGTRFLGFEWTTLYPTGGLINLCLPLDCSMQSVYLRAVRTQLLAPWTRCRLSISGSKVPGIYFESMIPADHRCIVWRTWDERKTGERNCRWEVNSNEFNSSSLSNVSRSCAHPCHIQFLQPREADSLLPSSDLASWSEGYVQEERPFT